MHSRSSRGKTLGGSTSINGGAWTRGLAAQYDAWSNLLEPEEASVGWNWDSLFAYMKKVCCAPGQRINPRADELLYLVGDVLGAERSTAREGRRLDCVLPRDQRAGAGDVPGCDVWWPTAARVRGHDCQLNGDQALQRP